MRTFGLEAGPLVPLITFTPYMGLTVAVPLVVALALRRWAVAVAAVAVAGAFALALLPRALADDQPAARGPTIRVMASNLYLGRGDPRAVVGLVARERVDVLALEELTPGALARLERAGLRRLLPHGRFDPASGGGSGSGLFTRWPMRSLPPANPRPQQGEPRGLIGVPRSGLPVDVQVIHPLPPTSGAWREVWNAMLDALPRPDPDGDTVRILAGDFNATLDHHRLRRLLGGEDGYVDAADAVGKGYATTWPAGRRFPPEITIDHVLVDPRVRVDDLAVHRVPGSDHRALVATLTLP